MPSTVLFTIGTTAVTATTIAAFVAKTVAAVVVSSLLSKKPKSGGADFSASARDQQITANNPVAPWRIVYGETLVSGTPVFMHLTNILGGEDELYAEDHTIAETVTVAQYTKYSGGVSVSFREVGPEGGWGTLTALTEVALLPAQGQYSVAGGVYTFNAADVGRAVYIEYRAKINPQVLTRYLSIVLELAGHEVEEIGDIYFDDEVIPVGPDGYSTGRFGQHVHIAKYTGTADQTADARLVSLSQGRWTANHRLRGRAYIIVGLHKNINLFPNGVPNIRAMIKGRKVYDPRSGLTAWSDNVALCTADYLTNATFGLGADYATEINEDLLTAAANICDEAVMLAAGGTEKRYTCNGAFLTSEAPKDVLGRLKVAMSGHIVRVGGQWDLYAGAWLTPTVTLDEDNLRGAIKVTSRISRRELFNGVKGVYASPDNNYQPADFPAVVSATYLAEDQGERAWLDIDLPFTNSSSMAQRIAKIELQRIRQQQTVSMPCKLAAFEVKVPEVVLVDNSKFGYSAKPFEIIEARLALDTDEEGAPYFGIDLVGRETAETLFDWLTEEELAADPAPDTILPGPFNITSPGTPTVTETLYETTGSAGVKSRVQVSVDSTVDAEAVEWIVEYRTIGGAWVARPPVRGFPDTLDDIAPATYEFRVRAFNRFGVASPYSPTTRLQVLGLSAAPAAVTGFSVIKTAGLGLAQWTLHPELDVQINGSIVIRHSPLTTGATWQDGIILEEFPGGVISGLVPLITGTYMAKAQDSSGNWSDSAVSFVATEGMVTGFTTVGTLTEHTAFTGSKTNVALDSGLGGIKLDGTTLIDSMVTTVDNWPFIDALGGVSGTGSYAFSTYMDLSTAATRRFELDVKALSYDTGDFIDDRLENIDGWNSIDGAVINDCDVTPYVRTTDDNPAGSPTWSAWAPFFVADLTCRAAQFKLDFISGNAQHNIVITELAVHAKEPA